MRPLALALSLFVASAAHAQFVENITVARILLDVRVTAYDGEPVTDLSAADFNVTIGGKRAQVESAEWIVDDQSGGQAILPVPVSDREGQAGVPVFHSGRLIVLFVQTDFAREPSRTRGQLNFLRYAEKMIATFDPEDRIAVFQFDSHLKFRLDFESDKEKVRDALRATIRIERPPAPPLVHAPALASRLDAGQMRRASTSEAGLRIVGDALRAIEGPKTLLLLGWGLGYRNAMGVKMSRHYAAAREALEASRTSIFALDTSYADYHDLQIGLAKAASDTGGFYAKTHLFPQLAVDRLKRTLIGHYELELRRPEELKHGTHDVVVRVARKRVDVLAPSTWMDRK